MGDRTNHNQVSDDQTEESSQDDPGRGGGYEAQGRRNRW